MVVMLMLRLLELLTNGEHAHRPYPMLSLADAVARDASPSVKCFISLGCRLGCRLGRRAQVRHAPRFGPLVAALHASDHKEQTMPSNENRSGERSPQGARDSERDAGNQRREPGSNADTPVEPTEAMKQSNPPRSNIHPEQTAEVPYGTGNHPEPPGGGGRPAQRKRPDDKHEH
jgi:hypothetical protein